MTPLDRRRRRYRPSPASVETISPCESVLRSLLGHRDETGELSPGTEDEEREDRRASSSRS